MIRDTDSIYFTDTDKENIVYRKYSNVEIEDRRKQIKKERSRRKVIHIVILAFFVIMSRFEKLQYAAGVAICFMIFLIIVGEIMDRLNRKLDSCPYYIEIQIDKKLPCEYYYDFAVSDGGVRREFFPIEGHDTTSGYQSVFYIDSEDYLNGDVGSKIKISFASIEQ